MKQLLLAVSEFNEHHITQIEQALDGWGTLTQLDRSSSPTAYAAAMAQAEIMFGWPPADVLLASPIRLLQLPSIGYDNYLGKGLEKKTDLAICNASSTMDPGISENILAMMLAFARHLPQHIRDQTAHRWQPRKSYGEINGVTVCIIGLGGLGSAIAERCAALGMQVVGVRRHADQPHPIAKTIYSMQQLTKAVANADHVVSVLPAAESTKQIINAAVFGAMKPTARFYNIGRGSTVDEAALIAALQAGTLAGAGLDVFETEPLPESSPLWDMEQVIITPHIGGRSEREYARQADLLCENIRRYRANEPLLNRVLEA